MVASVFFFILDGKEKSTQLLLFEIFLGFGGYIIKREDISTLSIRGYPRALRYLLILFSKLLFFVFVGFEKKFV